MATRSSTIVVKRLAIASASALLSVVVWTGAPLLALWVGSHFEGWIHGRAPGNGVTMRAVFVVVIVLALLEFVLALTLSRLSAAYDGLIGRPPLRRRYPWLNSMRSEREEVVAKRQGVTVVERVVVVSVVACALVFEFWFFFLAGSPLGNQ